MREGPTKLVHPPLFMLEAEGEEFSDGKRRRNTIICLFCTFRRAMVQTVLYQPIDYT